MLGPHQLRCFTHSLLGLHRCAVHALVARRSSAWLFTRSLLGLQQLTLPQRTRCSAFTAARFTHSLLGPQQLRCFGRSGARPSSASLLRALVARPSAASLLRALGCSALTAARFGHSLLGPQQLRCFGRSGARPSPLRGSRARVLGLQQLRCFGRSLLGCSAASLLRSVSPRLRLAPAAAATAGSAAHAAHAAHAASALQRSSCLCYPRR